MKKLLAGLCLLLITLSSSVYFYTHRPVDRIPPNTDNLSSINFFALGDQGSGSVSQWRVAHSMEKIAEKTRSLNFVTLLGDNFYGKGISSINDTMWQSRFEEVYQGEMLENIPFYAVLGNHDHLSNAAAQIEYSVKNMGSNRWAMPNWYYSKDFGNAGGRPIIRIVFIDTCMDYGDVVKEAQFIEEQFSDTHSKPIWKIVVGHYPVRNYGKHGEIPEFISLILPSLKKAHVDLYLSGHDHNQQVITHKDEPLYFISGGGGAELYPIIDTPPADLLFSSTSNGFLAMNVDKDILKAGFYDINGNPEVQYKIDRNCSLDLPDCINLLGE